ncbi:MAG: NADPH-dependent 7-cyano-7-deazaguanine reductase QueF [Pseudomonadota bacterium]
MTAYVEASPLGKNSEYVSQYQRDLLFPLPRQTKRDEIGVPDPLPFFGADIWNGYEISWLDSKGKPQVAVAEFVFPCTSPNIVESKSFKLYLNSFNNTQLDSAAAVTALMTRDLTAAVGAPVGVDLVKVDEFPDTKIQVFSGTNLDLLEVACDTYTVQPAFLTTQNSTAREVLFSNLLKSNCLVTGQPDWGSVKIEYQGNTINHEGLLKYIVSFRNHNEFHEQCVERIFMDIMRQCKPEKLSVYARYTRRGGLDINPYRSTQADYAPGNIRLCRQ